MKYLLLVFLAASMGLWEFSAEAQIQCRGASCGNNPNGGSLLGTTVIVNGGGSGANNSGQSGNNYYNLSQDQLQNNQTCFASGGSSGSNCLGVDVGGKKISVSGEFVNWCRSVGGSINQGGSCDVRSSNNVNADGAPADGVTTTSSAELCQQAVDNAVMTCDPNKSADVGAVMQMATGAQQALAAATGASIAAACGTLGKVSAAASTATAAYKGYCSYAYSKCQQVCNNALSDPKAVQDKAAVTKLLRQCNGMQQNIAEASTAVMGLIGAKLNMEQCAKMTTDCTLNPTAPTCVASTDCTNATTAATNIVCICQSNPADSRCGNSDSSSLPGGFTGGANLASTGGSTVDGSLGQFPFGSDGGMGSTYNPTANPSQQQPEQNLAQGMQGGHNLGSTGSVNNAYTPPGAAGSAAGKANILSGYYGGGSGGGFGSGSGSSGSGGGYGYNGGYRAGTLGQQNGLDLKQFLPGGAKDPARGIAGISGPDGITGPNSDIWQKVNTRYFSVSPSLLP
jgi:hypothetical protein